MYKHIYLIIYNTNNININMNINLNLNVDITYIILCICQFKNIYIYYININIKIKIHLMYRWIWDDLGKIMLGSVFTVSSESGWINYKSLPSGWERHLGSTFKVSENLGSSNGMHVACISLGLALAPIGPLIFKPFFWRNAVQICHCQTKETVTQEHKPTWFLRTLLPLHRMPQVGDLSRRKAKQP